jgi:UDP-N-acetylmuramyl tripeptide synthase
VVLIAGKGHEAYQERAGERTPFSDVAEAGAALRERGAA